MNNVSSEQALNAASPLVAAPRTAELAQLDDWQHRYIVARDGVYFEARTPHYRIVAPYTQVGAGTPSLPFGDVEPFFSFLKGGVDVRLVREIALRALICSISEGAWLVLDALPAGLRLIEPALVSVGGGHVSYETGAYQLGEIVIDAHSHGVHPACFSDTDDRSEDGAYVALVLGRCTACTTLELAARACFFGRNFPLALQRNEERVRFTLDGTCGAASRPYAVDSLVEE